VLTSIVVLSGNVGAGKTTLARLLATRFKAVHVKTHDLLNSLGPDVPQERRALQVYGELLDKRTEGTLVRDGLQRVVRGFPDEPIFVLDSVRIPQQVEAIRSSYGRKVVHVHLTADLATLRG